MGSTPSKIAAMRKRDYMPIVLSRKRELSPTDG
jgi:hypothetical protein